MSIFKSVLREIIKPIIHSVLGEGEGGIVPPVGYYFLVDKDGNYIVDKNGNRIITRKL